METFSHFEIINSRGERVVEGHKASFCLEDNDCVGVDPHYDCENYGDQVGGGWVTMIIMLTTFRV